MTPQIKEAIEADGFEDFLIIYTKTNGKIISIQVAGHGCPACMVEKIDKWAIDKCIEHTPEEKLIPN